MAKRLGKRRRWEQGVGAMVWGSVMGRAGKGGRGQGGGNNNNNNNNNNYYYNRCKVGR